jgi:dihydroflavonol-4-reductase
MKVLLTGATGLLGANVARSLLERGHAVRATVRGGSDTRGIDGLEVERVQASLGDADALAHAVAGCAGLVHCAASVWVGRTGEAEQTEVNVGGTSRLLEAALAAGVERVVHVSTIDALSLRADGEPASEDDRRPEPMYPCGYVRSKRGAEDAALSFVARGLPVVVVNPAFMLGPWDTRPTSGEMILQVAKGRARLAPTGGNCFVDVRHAAHSTVIALERGTPGRRHILGGVNLPYLEAWTRIARVVGASPPWGEAPGALAWLAGQAGALWGAVSGHEPSVNPVTAGMGQLPHYFRSDRARAELELQDTDFERCVDDAWKWFGDQGMA